MKRVFFLLSLTAVLSGPLLRAAEGADDLTRSLQELTSRSLVETVDGGVGDDLGDVVKGVRSTLPHERLAPDSLHPRAFGPAAWNAELATAAAIAANLDPLRTLARASHPPHERLGAPGRLAWLQRFLL